MLRKNRKQASSDVSKILKEWGIKTLVVGVPLGGSSESGRWKKRVEHLWCLLDFSGDIFYQDEAKVEA